MQIQIRSQLIWIYTVCKGRVYQGSAGQGLKQNLHPSPMMQYGKFEQKWPTGLGDMLVTFSHYTNIPYSNLDFMPVLDTYKYYEGWIKINALSSGQHFSIISIRTFYAHGHETPKLITGSGPNSNFA